MINLLDSVTLRDARPDLGVSADQQGAVIHVHGDNQFEVEFVDQKGRPVAQAVLTSAELKTAGASLSAASLRFVIYRLPDGTFTWRAQARPRRVIAQGASYGTKAACVSAIRLLAGQIRDAEVVDQTAA